jgi:hypothetical protein
MEGRWQRRGFGLEGTLGLAETAERESPAQCLSFVPTRTPSAVPGATSTSRARPPGDRHIALSRGRRRAALLHFRAAPFASRQDPGCRLELLRERFDRALGAGDLSVHPCLSHPQLAGRSRCSCLHLTLLSCVGRASCPQLRGGACAQRSNAPTHIRSNFSGSPGRRVARLTLKSRAVTGVQASERAFDTTADARRD